jgi:hypothetical protein
MVDGSRQGVPVSVRVPKELVDRLDRLVPKLAKDPAWHTLGIVSRTSAIKLALLRGVEALEKQYK